MHGVRVLLDPPSAALPGLATGCEPDREAARLAALHDHEILDTPPEVEFDRIAGLIAELLGTPAALVSLLDADRQWFKARIGVDALETPRAWSFCEHLLRPGAGDLLVVPDARLDPRFAANPYVQGGPGVRFYAGVPLRTPDGLILGTLCVLSPAPRPGGLAPAEARHLAVLAGLVSQTLALRRTARRAERLAREAEERRAREERLRLALDVADACAWELDPASGVTTWDPAARLMLGMPETLGFEAALSRVVHSDDRDRVRAAIAAALDPRGGGTYAVEHRTPGSRPDGGARWLRSLGQAWFDVGQGGVPRAVRLVCITMDITERHAARERQASLVAELNHRVKNTLAIVVALSEQTRRAAAPSWRAKPTRFHAAFQARLLALARAHDLLTSEAWRGASLAALVQLALLPHAGLPHDVGTGRVEIEGPAVQLAPEPAVTLALALHELAANAAHHGALSTPGGRVAVTWSRAEDGAALELLWREAGGPRVAGSPERRGFGLRLLERALGRQLGGEVRLDFAPDGLQVRVRLPRGVLAARS